MITFHIQRPQETIKVELTRKIDNLTKPKGSLGLLEKIAEQIGWIQQTLSPRLQNPCNVIFGGDHGIAAEGVSCSPPEVTRQMVANFLNGGAGVNFLARQHRFKLKVVDSGINFDFPALDGLIDLKIAKGTRNFLHEPAMSQEELELALERGAQVVTACQQEGCNIISFGEMGIGNTSASSMWMSLLAGIPLDECIGAGSGLNKSGVSRKQQILGQALTQYTGDISPKEIMRHFGGYEMVMAVGGMLRAAELGMIIIVDGFIMTNCILAASKLYPEVIDYALFGHQGDETGHKRLLQYLQATPILSLDLRLGEGTGAICAYPIIESAVRMINEMSSFSDAHVTKYF